MKLESSRLETFASERADGTKPPDAWRKAGYPHAGNRLYRLLQAPHAVARTQAITIEFQRTGSNDIGPIIEALMQMSKEAAAMDTDAGRHLAAGLANDAAGWAKKAADLANAPKPWVWDEALENGF